MAGVTRRLAALMRSWRPGVAVSWMSKAHLYTAPAAATRGVPTLWFQHGFPSPDDLIDRATALMPTRAVLAPSRTVAAVQARFWPRRPVHVAYPGVEPTPVVGGDPRDRLNALGVPAGAPVVGLVARLQRWKGVHVLLEAMPRLLEAHPSAHAVIVGGEHPLEPDYREELTAVADRLGIGERVHFAGHQPDGAAWMRGFDVVVHASRYEPFGLVVLEAMASGTPLVAGAAGGPSEVVRDGVDGFLVGFGDAETLAERIGRYFADPVLAARMADAARERAREFTPQRFAADVVGALRAEARPRS
jgi:glycosyltransferase involved in cell wall biosynthesis